VALTGACTEKPKIRSAPLALEATLEPIPPELARELVLSVRAQDKVGVGDTLGLELELRNASSGPVTMVRPFCGSWTLHRHVRFELEWTSAEGQPILDPLGFGLESRCKLDELRHADLLTVEAGSSAKLPNGPSRPQHVVLPTARPGRYTLRVRYVARGIEGASDLQLRSEPVEIEITEGDLASWNCRVEQLAAASNFEQVYVEPVALVEVSEAQQWLIVRVVRRRMAAGESRPAAEIWMQRLGTDLRPVGELELIRRTTDDLEQDVSAVAVADELLVLSTTSGKQPRLELQRVDLAGAHPEVSARRPVVVGSIASMRITAIAREDRLVVLYDRGAALTLRAISPSGQTLMEPRTLAPGAYDYELIPIGPDAQFAALWIMSGDRPHGVVQRFDATTGEALAKPIEFAFDFPHSIIGARITDRALELAWADWDAPDWRGLYGRRFSISDGHALEPVRALIDDSRERLPSGTVAWYGDNALIVESVDLQLAAHVGERLPVSLSKTAVGMDLDVTVVNSGYIVLWGDHRDDRSRTCTVLRHCVDEVYGALIGPDGDLLEWPRRLTTFAQPGPFDPPAHEWTEYCP
jgi:hypothetical protein